MKTLLFTSIFISALIHTHSYAAEAETKESKEQKKTMNITIETSLGTITAELYQEKAPLTVSNILAYVDDKFYDNTIFHRVITGFMIQGGGFTKDMQQKTTKPPVKNEADNGLSNTSGTLAMARTMIVDSATCQFFINLEDRNSSNLDFKIQDRYGVGLLRIWQGHRRNGCR